MGKKVTFRWGCLLCYREIEIGDKVGIGVRSHLSLVKIGDNVMIGPNVITLSGRRHHGITRIDVPMMVQEGEGKRKIIIGDDVWIGAGAIITEDVSTGCVVGAGAVVTKKF